uniref:ANK_REP_REGION domain-containing protein n=1 Tax=Macrostomum lignano TaxID=282301 RepID=A0A1I8I0P6_9PLAT
MEEMKEILVGLTDEGLDRLHELIPHLSEAEVNFKDKNGNGWLHWLTVSKNLQSLDPGRLVSLVYAYSLAGINYNMRNLTKNTALHFAVACSAPLPLINALLKIGVDPGFANSKGRTARTCTTNRAVLKTLEMFTPPLDEAIKEGDMQQVAELVSYWVKVTNYHLDISKRHPEIRDYLVEMRPTVTLVHRCLAGDASGLRAALEENPDLRLDLYDESRLNEDGSADRQPLLRQLIDCQYSLEAAQLLLERTRPDVDFQVRFREDEEDGSMMVPFWIAFKASNHVNKDILLPLVQNCVDYKTSLASLDHEIMLAFLAQEREIFDHLVKMGYQFWKPDSRMRTLADQAMLNELKRRDEFDASAILDSLEELDAALLPALRAMSDEELRATCLGTGYWPCVGWRNLAKLRHSKAKADKKLAQRLEQIEKVWILYRNLRKLTILGNTAGFRDTATQEACEVVDKKGQSLIHWAVIYERRFILKHILDKHPGQVDLRDHSTRTALHYAQGIDEEFMYNNLVRAGADPELPDNSASAGSDNRKSTGYPLLSNADMVKSHYRQAIKVERKDTSGHSHYLLAVYLNLCDAIEKNNEELFDQIIETFWPDLAFEALAKLNKTFPNQPHRFRNLITLCIEKEREEFGRRLLKAGIPVPSEVHSGDQTLQADEFARTVGMDQLADDIERQRNNRRSEASGAAAAAAAADAPNSAGDTRQPPRSDDFSDEGETIVSVDTQNSGATPEEPVKKPKKKKKKHHHHGDKAKGGKGKKKAKNNKVEESEVCTIL